MMDMLSNDDRLTLTDAVVHLINKDFRALGHDFVRLGFLQPGTDLEPLVPASRACWEVSWATAFKTSTSKRSPIASQS